MDVDIRDGIIKWFDTVKERIMKIDSTQGSDDQFSFTRAQSEGGQVYNFELMTLDLYKDKVKSKLSNPKDFSDMDSLFKAFQETKSEAW
jgi:hypothetical protein